MIKTKAVNQKKHSLRRCRERYGLRLTNEDYRMLVQRIQCNGAKFIERQSNRLTVWETDLPDGQRARIIYDSKSKQIVTALPVSTVGAREGVSDVHIR